ncbi:MAG: ferredoxin [Sulfolobales archaeon]|nr:ferredoxin [Sulfolobales archaeon]MCX8185552.1 ferredoxin [Sulfolobales archaeon]MDW7969495.1 ferredoxin [Sulfolobales archaeon]
MAGLKISVNQDTCIACGVCYSLCPQVFEAAGDGKTQIVSQYRVGGKATEGEVDESLKDCVETAKNSCPTFSIST